MKFYWYINESDETKQLINNCKPYINLLKSNGFPTAFFRGVSKSIQELISIHKVRKDRVPKGTNIEVFQEVNDFLEDGGHTRRDKSIIATSNIGWTKIFGSPYMIFPVGNFNYTYVRTYDFNNLKSNNKSSDNLKNFLLGNNLSDDQIDDALDELEKFISTNKNIGEAYKNGYEIWFDCDKYYLVELPTKKIQRMERAKEITKELKRGI